MLFKQSSEEKTHRDGKFCNPFISVCIPQYSRYQHIIAQLERLAAQTFKDFEVCISDDNSPERQWSAVCNRLDDLSIRYAYIVQRTNIRYDANLRAAIGLARGHYVLLMGNDDRLADTLSLSRICKRINEANSPDVVITNYRDLSNGERVARILDDGLVTSGLDAAISSYRNYSFVSGIVFDRKKAQLSATDNWDGSEMYQMAIGTRIVATGGRLLGLSETFIEKDIQIPGVVVDSYANRHEEPSGLFRPKITPLVVYAATCWDALRPAVPIKDANAVGWRILRQTLMFTYPYWIVQYKRTRGVRCAFRFALGMQPRFVRKGLPRSILSDMKAWILYSAVTVTGLLFPVGPFGKHFQRFHHVAKRFCK